MVFLLLKALKYIIRIVIAATFIVIIIIIVQLISSRLGNQIYPPECLTFNERSLAWSAKYALTF
jgi:hypothetical protein